MTMTRPRCLGESYGVAVYSSVQPDHHYHGGWSWTLLSLQTILLGVSAGATYAWLQHVTPASTAPSSRAVSDNSRRIGTLLQRLKEGAHSLSKHCCSCLSSDNNDKKLAVGWVWVLGGVIAWWSLPRKSRHSWGWWWLWTSMLLGQKYYSYNRDHDTDQDQERETRNVTQDTEPSQSRDREPRDVRRSEHPEQTSSSSSIESGTSVPQQPYLELLVHNVSHTDLVLSLDVPISADEQDMYCLCRPRFSCFDGYSRRVLEACQEQWSETVTFPRYERSYETPRYSIKEEPDGTPIPTGLALPTTDSLQVPPEDLPQLRVRGRDQAKLARHLAELRDDDTLHIRHVFFPLLATLLPRWQRQIASKEYSRPVKRVLILVSGVGTPRNWTHEMTGNSTQACAELMENFVKRIDPDLTVVKIHSEYNVFRYDENLLFAERELMPTVNGYRDAHAYGLPYPDEQTVAIPSTSRQRQPFNTEWPKSLSLTLSWGDGSPARTYAIQASLRGYRPDYFHFWQLKTFWHESKIVDDDIEVHSYEEMQTSPAVDTSRITDPMIQAVVQEMKDFYSEMMHTLQDNSNDIRKFWLRKTHKPVLAVLLVQSPGREPELYRGTNMEVSMPTGSLCAERNVIGSALAENPGLKREDLKYIAVLAVPLVEEVTTDVKRVPSVSDMKRVPSTSSIVEDPGAGRKASLGSENETEPDAETSYTLVEDQCVECDTSTEPSSPKRRIALFSKSERGKSKRTVVVHSTKDLNPLRPCGACNEWLKKIAESNPYFKILTFTDAECNGIYVTPCQD